MTEWNTTEVLYSMNNAGFMMVSDIAEGCGHSTEEVEALFDSLGISAVLLVPPVRVCPACGNMRQTAISNSGLCQACRHKNALHETEAEFQDLLSRAPETIKALYAKNDGQTQSDIPPMPSRPIISDHATIKQRKIAQAAFEGAVEEWEIVTYRRQHDSARQRLKRLREKMGEPPNKKRRKPVL